MERRVVITGLGVVSPLGLGKERFWQSLIAGRSGVRRVTRFDPTGYDCQVAGEIPDDSYKDLIEPKRLRRMTNVTQMAVAAAQLALTDAGLPPTWHNPHTAGVVVGTAVGTYKDGLEQQSILLEKGANRVNPFITVALHINSIAAEVAITARTQGPALTLAGGCASSVCAISTATDMIRGGTLDVCLSGGAESPIIPLLFAGMGRVNELATWKAAPEQASRPFDRGHNGLVPSEGGCLLVLEERAHAERRGAPIYGEILGCALGCEAYEAAGLEPTGDSAVYTLHEALQRAQVHPAEIDWINAHGSSCPEWDRRETHILKRGLGEHAYTIPISATKSMTGHAFGVAAAFQVASAVLAMRAALLPATINLEIPDPECDLDYIRQQPRPLASQTCLINSFAYGGINSFLLIRRS